MSINRTQYEINIISLQRILKMIHSIPSARLEIEPGRVALVIQGEYAWVVHGREEVAKVLARAVDHFYEKNDDEPVEPDLDIDEQVVREIPFSYREAIGRIFQGDKGWGGEFTLGSVKMTLRDQFIKPETVEKELRYIVDNCQEFAIGFQGDS